MADDTGIEEAEYKKFKNTIKEMKNRRKKKTNDAVSFITQTNLYEDSAAGTIREMLG